MRPTNSLYPQRCSFLIHARLCGTCCAASAPFQLKAIGWEDRFWIHWPSLGTCCRIAINCIKCNILHPVQPDDVPKFDKLVSPPPPLMPHTRPNVWSCACPQYFYAVMFHHVQLALKYSRMKEKHQDCRTNILQNFEIRPVGSPIIKSFAAKPEVVNARFILLAT